MNKDIDQLVDNIDELLETNNLSVLERNKILRQLDDRLIESVCIQKKDASKRALRKASNVPSSDNILFGLSKEDNKRLASILNMYKNSR